MFNQTRIITVDKIQNIVSDCLTLLADMLSHVDLTFNWPRQVAMYLAKTMTTRSLPVGRDANRDHTTVIHAVKTITKLSETDEEMKKRPIQ